MDSRAIEERVSKKMNGDGKRSTRGIKTQEKYIIEIKNADLRQRVATKQSLVDCWRNKN